MILGYTYEIHSVFESTFRLINKHFVEYRLNKKIPTRYQFFYYQNMMYVNLYVGCKSIFNLICGYKIRTWSWFGQNKNLDFFFIKKNNFEKFT